MLQQYFQYRVLAGRFCGKGGLSFMNALEALNGQKKFILSGFFKMWTKLRRLCYRKNARFICSQ